jgi:sodium-dependent dicarboxylate transporter 2/3/5
MAVLILLSAVNHSPLKFLLCLAAAAVVWFLTPEPMTLKHGMAVFVLIGLLWVTQAISITVTALLVPLLAVITGLMQPREALVPFSNPIIFLFLGGFSIAAALSHQGLDKTLASNVIRLSGGKRLNAVLLLCGAAALLSMWISNTATVAMMLPLALGLLNMPGAPSGGGNGTDAGAQVESNWRENSFILLSLAYSASIGGIGTVIGSPPNAIAAAEAKISFAAWMMFGIPLALLLWPIMLVLLYVMLRPRLSGRIDIPVPKTIKERSKLITLGIFGLTVTLWILSVPLAKALDVRGDMDSMIAILAIFLLIISGSVTWKKIEADSHWGILLLFGGGIALSEVMRKSEVSQFLAESFLVHSGAIPAFFVVLLIIAFVVFLTELVSNTASAALLIPIFTVVAAGLGLSQQSMAAMIAVSASCAFMLPVATPPNAIVFATDQVSQSTMMRCGLLLNGVCIGVITAMAYWLAKS